MEIIQNNLNQVEEAWEEQDTCVGNRTNPNSIYVKRVA